MSKYFLITISLMLALTWRLYPSKVIVRIDSPDSAGISELISGEYDIASYVPGKYADIVVSEDTAAQLKNDFTDISTVRNENDIRLFLKRTKDIPGYRTYEETLAELQKLEADNPEICRLYNIGSSQGKVYFEEGNGSYSYFDHSVWALKVSDNVEYEEDEPSVYFMGAHHAREPIGTEVTMTILNDLVGGYNSSDPDAVRRVSGSQIWFVPVVNPDGQKIVLDQTDVWWRKNIRDNDSGGALTMDYDGVDLNRNYGFWWGPNGTSDDPASLLYKGPEPWSEPEIKAVKQLLDSHKFVAGISYHSYSELVLYPYGYEPGAVAPDRDALRSLAENMAYTIPSLYGGYYYPCQSVELYPTMGSTDDYAYGEHGTFAFTIELGIEFIPPYETVTGICADNLEAAYILMDRTMNSMVTGTVTDGVTKSAIEAEVYVEEVDATGVYRAAYKSDPGSGRYYRLLEPGAYNITFSAFGYDPVTILGVIISDSGITELDISLSPALTYSISGQISDADSFEPVAEVKVTLGQTLETVTDSDGRYFLTGVPDGVNEISLTCSNYMTVNSVLDISGNISDADFSMAKGNMEDFETHDFSSFNWSFGEETDWFISSVDAYFGDFYARSGILGSYGPSSSSLILSDSLVENGTVSFSFLMENTMPGDVLSFKIDGTVKGSWSRGRWGEVSFPVTSGVHEFEWSFIQGSEWDGYDHFAALDNIKFPGIRTTGIEDLATCPQDLMITGNYPNPFNPVTRIGFVTDKYGKISLSVYNITGQLVRELLNGSFSPGKYHAEFNAGDLNSGIYYIVLRSENSSASHPVLLLK